MFEWDMDGWMLSIAKISFCSYRLGRLLITITFFTIACTSQPQSSKLSDPVAADLGSLNELFSGDSMSTSSNQRVRLISWNIQDLGGTKNAFELQRMVAILKNYDLIVIQEVVAKDPRGAQAVALLDDLLDRTGSNWDYTVSDETSSSKPKQRERYAYLWRTNVLNKRLDARLDTALSDLCLREPYLAQFRVVGGGSFFVVNFHSKIYDEHPEDEIRYFSEYKRRFNSDKVLIVGDFNLDEKHPVWEDLYRKGYASVLKNTKTTLKRSCKGHQYLSHSIDNIYYDTMGFSVVDGATYDFVRECSNLKEARKLSDHLPVIMEFKLK